MILKTLVKAVAELNGPCEIHIHTQNDYILNAIGRYLPQWAQNGYQTTRGQLVRNHFDWAMLHDAAARHEIVAEPGMHFRYGEMLDDMKNAQKAHKSYVGTEKRAKGTP